VIRFDFDVVSPEARFEVMTEVVPRPIAVVTSRDAADRLNASRRVASHQLPHDGIVRRRAQLRDEADAPCARWCGINF
jgi:hypothetical protein